MEVIGVKVLGAFVFFLLTIVCGLTPYWCLAFYSQRRRLGVQQSGRGHISLVQCLHSLASGVLIATCLLHLLPESLEAVQTAIAAKYDGLLFNSNLTSIKSSDIKNSDIGVDDRLDEHFYPFGELLVGLGFLCIFIIDRGVKSCYTCKPGATNAVNGASDDDVAFMWTNQTDSNQNITIQRSGVGRSDRHPEDTNRQLVELIRSKFTRSLGSYEPIQERGKIFDLDNNEYSETDVTESDNADHRFYKTDSGSLRSNKTSFSSFSLLEVQPQANQHGSLKFSKPNHLKSVALVAALCVHGFFDGVMLGLQTSLSASLSLLLALSLHKSFVAVGLSLSLYSNSHKHSSLVRILLLIVLFAAASPVGVLMSGLYLHEAVGEFSDGHTSLTAGCMQSFAVGTFMFVAFTETIERQQQTTISADIVSHIFLLTGFGVMAGLRAVVRGS